MVSDTVPSSARAEDNEAAAKVANASSAARMTDEMFMGGFPGFL